MQKTFFTILAVVFLSVPLVGQEAALPESTQPDSTEIGSLSEKEPAYRKKPHIAILPFTNANAQAKEAEFGRTVSSMLATALRNQTNFIVLERNELHQVLTEQVLQESGLTKEQTQELAKIYNVEVILTGDISLINNTLHIDARLVEIKSSEIVVALYGTCHDLNQIRTVVEDLANQLEGTYLRQWMGNLSITSEPAGAEIYLENKFIGFTEGKKPLLVNNLLEGAYHLKLIRGGYEDWQGDIAVQSKMERTVKVSLIAKPGSMNIYSEPAGARVFLDNNPVGETPISLKTVAEGEHEIRLVKEDYEAWTEKVVVRSFRPTDVKAILEVSPGMLTIHSTPGNADIFFKGKFVAKTPHTLSNIQPGEIVVRVEKERYEEWTTSVFIQPNNHQVLDVSLEEKVGTLSITSEPEGATVYLIKEEQVLQEIGETPILNFSTPIGEYTLEVEKEDYFNAHKEVVVSHKQLSETKFELEEKPGSILVMTTPANARVSLDGSFLGRTPFRIDDLVKGEYKLTATLPYAKKTETIKVETNRQSVMKTKFKKSKRYILGVTSIGVVGLLFHLLAK
ncbi:PEGA domain-containing protein [candidate division KSB1 bacterium]|nr:PEGA domain-containing protein [candidate division KSB1 bacterium]